MPRVPNAPAGPMPESCSSCEVPIAPSAQDHLAGGIGGEELVVRSVLDAVQRMPETVRERTDAPVITVRLDRPRTGRRYASAADWRTPSTKVNSGWETPTRSTPLRSVSIGYSSSSNARSTARATGCTALPAPAPLGHPCRDTADRGHQPPRWHGSTGADPRNSSPLRPSPSRRSLSDRPERTSWR